MIDQKLIDAHQWVVDVTERQPAWWVEQTAWAFVAVSLVAKAMAWGGGWDAVSVVLTLVMGTCMIASARSPARLAFFGKGQYGTRGLFVAFMVYDAVILFVAPSSAVAARLLSSMLLVSCFYFAACEPPRPRKRRQVARTSHASA